MKLLICCCHSFSPPFCAVLIVECFLAVVAVTKVWFCSKCSKAIQFKTKNILLKTKITIMPAPPSPPSIPQQSSLLNFVGQLESGVINFWSTTRVEGKKNQVLPFRLVVVHVDRQAKMKTDKLLYQAQAVCQGMHSQTGKVSERGKWKGGRGKKKGNRKKRKDRMNGFGQSTVDTW